MNGLTRVNIFLGIALFLCYFYQIIYLLVAYFGKDKRPPKPSTNRRFAVMIAARNEENVIHNLLISLKRQSYPESLFKVFVVADNCTDRTADIARGLGAVVYERQNENEVGKGFALDFLMKSIARDLGRYAFDTYVVFDADNTLDEDFLSKINESMTPDYEVMTSYRLPSNYADSWRAAGGGMFFVRESRIMNCARGRLGFNTFVTGTGFAFSAKLGEKYGGWPFHTLTEDGEFTMQNVISNVKSGYSAEAIFYDEQAVGRQNSWRQRLRWCRGGVEIFRKYAKGLFKGLLSVRGFTFFDMLMCLAPAYFFSLLSVTVNLACIIISLAVGVPIAYIIRGLIPVAAAVYLLPLVFSLTLTVSEWKRLKAPTAKKILYAFTFPFYIFSFIPASFSALLVKVEWKPVTHGAKKKKAP